MRMMFKELNFIYNEALSACWSSWQDCDASFMIFKKLSDWKSTEDMKADFTALMKLR